MAKCESKGALPHMPVPARTCDHATFNSQSAQQNDACTAKRKHVITL